MKPSAKKTTVRTAEGDVIPVFCSPHKLLDPRKLKPFPDNPNTHPDSQIELLAAVIAGTPEHPGNGLRRNIVVSRRSGYVTKGHGLRLACIRLGCLAPVEYQDYRTAADEVRDVLADNRIAEFSERDPKLLLALANSLSTDDLPGTGYTEDALAALADGLAEDLVELKQMETNPPDLAWVVFNIPLNAWGQISHLVEQISAVPGVQLEHSLETKSAS